MRLKALLYISVLLLAPSMARADTITYDLFSAAAPIVGGEYDVLTFIAPHDLAFDAEVAFIQSTNTIPLGLSEQTLRLTNESIDAWLVGNFGDVQYEWSPVPLSEAEMLLAELRWSRRGSSHVLDFDRANVTADPPAVPEPASLLLVGMGMLAAGLAKLRRRA